MQLQNIVLNPTDIRTVTIMFEPDKDSHAHFASFTEADVRSCMEDLFHQHGFRFSVIHAFEVDYRKKVQCQGPMAGYVEWFCQLTVEFS